MAKRHTAAAAACLLLAGCLVWAGRKRTVTYLPDESAFPNAQIGYAPGVLDSGTEGATLRYLGLTWRQLEPEEGLPPPRPFRAALRALVRARTSPSALARQ